MMIDDMARIADERDDLARRLADAKRLLADMERQKPRRRLKLPFSR